MFLIEKVLADNSFEAINVSTATSNNISDLATSVIGWITLLAGIIATIYLLYSGILYLTAAGNPDAAKKGQQGVVNAIIGIIVIVLARVIIKAVAGTIGG